MASSNVSSVTNYFPTVNEGFTTTLNGDILSGATTIPLVSTSGLTNATIFVGIIEPGVTNQQVFTGTVDTGGSQITGVKWTRGTNVNHASGVTIVDYVTGTAVNMITTGLLKEHTQAGRHNMTSPKVTTDISDTNGNELFKVIATSSAVNEFTVANAASGNSPALSATGAGTDLDINLTPKGAGLLKVGGITMQHTAWTSFTPSWNNLTISSSTVSAAYCTIGKTVFVRVSVIAAGSFAIAGAVEFTLPVAPKTTAGYLTNDVIGNTMYLDSSASTFYAGQAWIGTTTTRAQLVIAIADATYLKVNGISGTVPFTWAVPDEIHISLAYERA